MEKVMFNTSPCYEVIIDNDILNSVGETVKQYMPERVALITDTHVDKLYAEKVGASLGGLLTFKHILDSGEKSKTPDEILKIIKKLDMHGFDRRDLIVSLGGGTVSDVSGFAASVYKRGIRYIQIPTTLLAAADASLGGKNGVDLQTGKNIMGTVWQPCKVICDTSTFNTLPEKEYACGMAEVIKYAFISDMSLLMITDINELVKRCAEIKSKFVSADEHDFGIRRMLNFGHTIGHAVEKCSAYEIPHGEAISVGMVYAAKMADLISISEVSSVDEIIKALKKFNLPVTTDFNHNDLFSALLHDKKICGKYISLVLPIRPGKCVIYDMDILKFKDALSLI